jgi:nucleotide-binding universal stress UspA family protein
MFNSVQLADRGSSKPPASGEGAKDAVGDAVKGTSEDGERTQHAKDDKMEADVTVRDVDSHREEAVAREARKGYDLLFIGIERARAKTGGFHAEVARIASRFEGPQAIVAANGVHLLQPEVSRLRLLVPVNGTLVSRRAAEIAIAVARVLEAPIAALYVSNANPRSAAKSPRKPRRRGHEQAILKDIVEIPDQYGQPIDTVVRSAIAPDEAILAEARRRGSNLIVMGVAGRPGENLFSGDTAASVLEKTPTSVLFLST